MRDFLRNLPYGFLVLAAIVFIIPLEITRKFSDNPSSRQLLLIVFLAQQVVAWFISVSFLLVNSKITSWLKKLSTGYKSPGWIWLILSLFSLVSGLLDLYTMQ